MALPTDSGPFGVPPKKKKKKPKATTGGPAQTGVSGGADPFYKKPKSKPKATSGGPAHAGLPGSAVSYNPKTGGYDGPSQKQFDLWEAAARRAAELRRQAALREARRQARRVANEESSTSILGLRRQGTPSFVDSVLSIPRYRTPKEKQDGPPLPFEADPRMGTEPASTAISATGSPTGLLEENLAIEGEDAREAKRELNIPKPVRQYQELLERFLSERSPGIRSLLSGGQPGAGLTSNLLGIDGEEASLFPAMSSSSDLPEWGLGEPFPFFLMEKPGGGLMVQDINQVLDHYLLQVQDDPQDAAALALAIAKINGDTSYEQALQDRLVNTTGGQALRWSSDDDKAFLDALGRASREQANLVQNGNYMSLDDVLGNLANRGLGTEIAETRYDRDGDGDLDDLSVPQEISLLPPGNYAGYQINQEQMGNLDVIASVGRSMGMTERDIGIAIIAAITETNIRNLDHGDRDSLGIFQQRSSWGSAAQRQDPVYASQKFFEALKGVQNRGKMSMGEAAQAVQRSAFPDRYAEHVAVAEAILGPDPFRRHSAPIQMIGPVKQHVRAAAEEISGAFGIDNIGGYAESGHIPGSYHYKGQAIDVMLEGSRDGKAIADYAVRNAKRIGAIEVIHNGQYWSRDGGWEPYTGADPHTGHVHVSFAAGPGQGGRMSGYAPMPGGTSTGSGYSYASGGGGSGYEGGYGSAPVQYSDPLKIGQVADAVATNKIGRELDEDEIDAIVQRLHLAEQQYTQDSAAGLSATFPDLQGIIEAYIEDKLSEEQQMQLEGELAMAAFQLLAGGIV